DESWCPEVSNHILEQLPHGRWLTCVAFVPTHTVHVFQVLQDWFIWVSSRDADRHTFLCKQPRATGANARTTPTNQGNVFHLSCSIRVRQFAFRLHVLALEADWPAHAVFGLFRCAPTPARAGPVPWPLSLMARRPRVTRSVGRKPGCEPQCFPWVVR